MNIEIRDIITPEIIKLQEAFALATGFGVVFTDKEGNHIGEGSNFQKICQAINSTEEGRLLCAESNRRAINLALETGLASIYICHAGMINIEIPILVDGVFIGAVTAGQVLSDKMHTYPADSFCTTKKFKFEEPYSTYYNEVPTLPKERVLGTAETLAQLAKYIVSNYVKHIDDAKLLALEQKNHENLLREQQLLQELTEVRYLALQKQITPHFVCNVLSTISRLIELEKFDSAQQMLDRFAEMFRFHSSGTHHGIRLLKELEYIDNYLSINKIRFGDKLNYSINVDSAMHDLPIPFFSLQPFVENALEHGLLDTEKGGDISIQGKITPNSYLIKIIDNGKGINEIEHSSLLKVISDMNSTKKQQTAPDRRIYSLFLDENSCIVSKESSHGIYSCITRLNLFYNFHVSIDIETAVGVGTTVSIEIEK